MHAVALTHHQDPGGILVDAMDDSRAQFTANAAQVCAVAEQRIDQGTVGVARGRMHHHAGRLVDHDQMLVLIEDGQRNVLSNRPGLNWRRLPDDRFIPWTQLGAGLGGFAVDQHAALIDQTLDLRASEPQIRIYEKVVQPHTQVRIIARRAQDVARDHIVAHQIFDLTCPLDLTRTSTRARS